MATQQELQVQEKREIGKPEEATAAVNFYMPTTDIYESEDSLILVMEMPGVDKESLSVNLENDQLQLEGKIEMANYEGLEPVYTEYSIGHYKRTFTLSNRIDQDKISATFSDGLLTLTLPKAQELKPRKISIS